MVEFQVTLTILLKSILHAAYNMQMEEVAGNIYINIRWQSSSLRSIEE